MAEGKKRHPLRLVFRLLVFAGLAAAAAKVVGAKKGEFKGMTESQAREKFEQKLASRIGDEAASEIADKVIPKLKEKGVIKDDYEVSESSEGDTADAEDEMADAVQEVTQD